MKQGLADKGRQSTALPVEIGFLAHHGYAPAMLHEVAVLAAFSGVSADRFLLSHGFVGEHEFYRALAAELALPFLPAPQVSRAARYPGSILAGVAPLARGGFVLAPTGASLVHILKSRRPPRGMIVLTAPSLRARAVFHAQPGAIARRAAGELLYHQPGMSSRPGIGAGHLAGLALMTLILCFCAPPFPLETLTAIGGTLSLLFFGMVVLRLAAIVLGGPIAPEMPLARHEDAALPIYTIIVALYREKRVAQRLIRALARLDYPASKLDIKLVLEADDRETIAALASIDKPPFIETIIAPPGEPRTKPRALNVALPLARGRFTVIYDAEDVPDPRQLRASVASFARLTGEIACLQARLTIDNTDDSWITRLFTIEYAALFDVFNPGLAALGTPVPLGGTSNHFRTSVLKAIHGWDAWNVTEDADLGIRLARLGYRIADLPSSTLEEAPSTLRAWMKQRTRWMKGFMQTSISHTRQPWAVLRQMGFWRFYSGLVLTSGTVLSALTYPVFTGLAILFWLSGLPPVVTVGQRLVHSGSMVLFAFGILAIFIPACVALHRRGLWRLFPWVFLLPLYYGLVSLAAWRGLWELMTDRFRWNKTSHGHARTSRSGLL
jgi:cellulose synthase/poly-beta-1,6-N-acetylglucosamine synthase-like glycosyltransferase